MDIDHLDDTFILSVDEEPSAAIESHFLERATDLDIRFEFSGGSVDHSENAAVADKDLFGVGIVDNGIGFLSMERDDLERLQRLKVEHGDGVVLAVAGEAMVELRCERDAMHAVGGRDRAEFFAGI